MKTSDQVLIMMEETEESNLGDPSPTSDAACGKCPRCPMGNKARNLIGFWLLGLCNNYGYVIMLSGAYDILGNKSHHTNGTNSSSGGYEDFAQNRSGKLIPECNKMGTGVILLADILPGLIIKTTAPWYIQSISYRVKITVSILLGLTSYPVVAIPTNVAVNIFGVALASAGSGLGELVFLSLTTKYDKNSVSTWSSGTGAAGVFGAVSYAGLTAAGVSPQTTILSMVFIPALMAFSYFILLPEAAPVEEPGTLYVDPPPDKGSPDPAPQGDLDSDPSLNLQSQEEEHLLPRAKPKEQPVLTLSFLQKLKLIQPLLKYMIPLALVYVAQYFVNQALFELILFYGIWPPKDQQYRWYQTIYQIGVLISRSSVNLVKIRKIWILTILQFVILILFMVQIFHHFLPSIWIVFTVILFEGLIGGAAYVNTFYWISADVKSLDRREFSMGVASISDTFGISLAGAISIPVHNFLCDL